MSEMPKKSARETHLFQEVESPVAAGVVRHLIKEEG